ncbi:hypothetical protein CH63R_12439 [Colletotrichum higginsianum IMI 349063]|uniref:Uncharacterized protein n=1 Tax=Colletotrichum higginsianum (strain IMI 349063) TaxID=759273 RepID=A0A1B7XU60_COLHI|nr:hypothetical protein CH63R_12439 [Colletotrichum higginsianum IMI 349063]OBR03312.1 hypothetical protein CH63R_12439 [Colletotrichum higginsianum IMI 349063]
MCPCDPVGAVPVVFEPLRIDKLSQRTIVRSKTGRSMGLEATMTAMPDCSTPLTEAEANPRVMLTKSAVRV